MHVNRDELEEGRIYLLEFYPNSKVKRRIAGPYKVKFVGYGRTEEGGNSNEWQRFVQLFEDGRLHNTSKEFALNNERIHQIRLEEANKDIEGISTHYNPQRHNLHLSKTWNQWSAGTSADFIEYCDYKRGKPQSALVRIMGEQLVVPLTHLVERRLKRAIPKT